MKLSPSVRGADPIRQQGLQTKVMAHSDSLTSSYKQAASATLARSRAAIEKLVVPAASGVYAIYLRAHGLLSPFEVGEGGLIYIGCSTNLSDREFEQHFSSDKTGFSTLRRSIGALLKRQLALRAIPRAPGISETNVRNYRFADDDEARLTSWMCAHLEIAVHSSAKYPELEDFLVSELQPLLNLTKWPNPDRAEIKRLRKVCADEARTAARRISDRLGIRPG